MGCVTTVEETGRIRRGRLSWREGVGCGSGRTSLLQRLRDRVGRGAAQYVDVERCATTPERFLGAVVSSSPFPWNGEDRQPPNAREAFDALLSFFDTARAPGGMAFANGRDADWRSR